MSSPSLDLALKRGVAEIIVEQDFENLLNSGRKLRFKQGFDPSRPDIHLGHVVSLRKLRQFQEMGHHVVVIIGDWTAQIGDPSGESQTRPMLSRDEVLANAETYLKQFFKVVDEQRTEVRWQSEWFENFTLADVIALTSKFTIAQLMAREDFAKRQQAGKPIALSELLYPLLQAYDSVVVYADVELGGIDQKFNCLVGRELQQMMGQRPQQVFLTPLLVGTDGSQKMSKSLGNYIAIEDPPNEMYGKVMSIPDELILDYFELLTDVDDEMLTEYRKLLSDNSKNPMEIKKFLAWEIVRQFHGIQAAEDAQEHFERVVQRKEMPEEIEPFRVSFNHLRELHRQRLIRRGDIPEAPGATKVVPPANSGSLNFSIEVVGTSRHKHVKVHVGEFLHLSGLISGSSEAKRQIAQGAIELDGVRIDSFTDARPIKDGSIIRVGKRRFVKIVDADKKSD